MNITNVCARFLARATAVLVAANALVSACSSSSRTLPPEDPTEACSALATTMCNREAECDPVRLRSTWGNLATCIERKKLRCSSEGSLPGTSWTATKIRSCDQDLGAQSCDDLDRSSFTCISTPGSLPNGAACTAYFQCAGGDCIHSNPVGDGGLTSDAFCGKCATFPPPPPVTCGDGPACVPPKKCVFDETTGYCLSAQPEGAHCSAPLSFCAAGLRCDSESSTCKKPPGAGAVCSSLYQCDVTAGLICGPLNTCEAPPFNDVGAPCDPLYSPCIGPAFCEGGICVMPFSDGSPCDRSDHCLSPAFCSDGICKTKVECK